MKSLILCAGKGSRFNTNTKSIPKCLIEINKKRILDIQILSLRKNNIKNIAVVTGYKSELINHKLITKYYKNKNWEKTNMIYSLFEASEWLSESDCIISYGDIFFSDLPNDPTAVLTAEDIIIFFIILDYIINLFFQ